MKVPLFSMFFRKKISFLFVLQGFMYEGETKIRNLYYYDNRIVIEGN